MTRQKSISLSLSTTNLMLHGRHVLGTGLLVVHVYGRVGGAGLAGHVRSVYSIMDNGLLWMDRRVIGCWGVSEPGVRDSVVVTVMRIHTAAVGN